jgi:hypothetical protein
MIHNLGIEFVMQDALGIQNWVLFDKGCHLIFRKVEFTLATDGSLSWREWTG